MICTESRKILCQSLSFVAMGAMAIATFPSQALSQVNTAPTLSEQTLRDAQQQERSPMSVGGSNLNIMQLINNINLAGGKSPEQFRSEQSESLNEAVNKDRKSVV